MQVSTKNKIILIISIIETIYLIYMFHFFKTRLNFNVLPEFSFTQKHKFLKHLNDDTYGLRICPFGRIIIFLLIIVKTNRKTDFFKLTKHRPNARDFLAICYPPCSQARNDDFCVHVFPNF